MKDRNDCWLTFTESLEMYLTARAERADAPVGSHRWEKASEDMNVASQHMDILTSAHAPAIAPLTASGTAQVPVATPSTEAEHTRRRNRP
ncbi:MAG: hypothetical protein O9327_05855 [Polaromonas sp.]|nr:hypothetical protein [Polaromonas sp.]